MHDDLKEQRDIARAGMFYWMRKAAVMALRSEAAILTWQEDMARGLHDAYEKMGAPRSSGPEGFISYVVGRDETLGLEAGGSIVSEGEFSYWIKCPFTPLKDKISERDYEKLSTHGYLKAKLDYFCPDFKAEMTKTRGGATAGLSG